MCAGPKRTELLFTASVHFFNKRCFSMCAYFSDRFLWVKPFVGNIFGLLEGASRANLDPLYLKPSTVSGSEGPRQVFLNKSANLAALTGFGRILPVRIGGDGALDDDDLPGVQATRYGSSVRDHLQSGH